MLVVYLKYYYYYQYFDNERSLLDRTSIRLLLVASLNWRRKVVEEMIRHLSIL